MLNMTRKRLRPSIFPHMAPFLNFLAPEEDYEEEGETVEDLGMMFTTPNGTSPPIIECFQRLGLKHVEVCRLMKQLC